MTRVGVTFAFACSALAFAAPGQAAINVGVADDLPVGQPDGGAASFALMNDVGLKEIRLSVLWDSSQPTTIANQAQIEAVLPVATLRGVNQAVIFARPAHERMTSHYQAADAGGKIDDHGRARNACVRRQVTLTL